MLHSRLISESIFSPSFILHPNRSMSAGPCTSAFIHRIKVPPVLGETTLHHSYGGSIPSGVITAPHLRHHHLQKRHHIYQLWRPKAKELHNTRYAKARQSSRYISRRDATSTSRSDGISVHSHWSYQLHPRNVSSAMSRRRRGQ
jgi:hypothetical protein